MLLYALCSVTLRVEGAATYSPEELLMTLAHDSICKPCHTVLQHRCGTVNTAT